jgi:hypothetical protein
LHALVEALLILAVTKHTEEIAVRLRRYIDDLTQFTEYVFFPDNQDTLETFQEQNLLLTPPTSA